MKQKKYIHKKDKALDKNTVFCSECGDDLEMVGIEKVDIPKIKERHQRCRDIGKFKGDKCGMLFIAESNDDLFEDEESLNTDL